MGKYSLISTLVAILAIVAACFLWNERTRWKEEANAASNSLLEQRDTIRYWENRYGEIVAEKASIELTAVQFQKYYQDDIKRIREELGIRDRNIKAYIRAEFAANGRGTITVLHDTTSTVIKPLLRFSDNHLTLTSGLNDGDSLTYTYQDELIGTIHTKKKWVFGNEKYYFSGKLSNPNARITSSTSVLVKARDKRYVVSIGPGWGIYHSDGVIHSGWGFNVHVGYKLISF